MSGTQYPPQGQQQYPPQQQPPYQQQSAGVVPPHQQQPAPQQPPPQPSPADKAAADKAKAEQREVQAFGSIGAQIILDYNGDGSLGARGGAAPTIEENTAARDSHYIALGLDPLAPSGPPPSLEVRRARKAVEEAKAEAGRRVEAAHAAPGAGAASRVSSLAAGLITEAADVPIDPPPPTRSQGAQSGGATTVSVSKTV
jgi:hypothetical protein